MNIFFAYPCLKWGHIIWQPYPTGSGIKMAQNMAHFHYFSFFENLSICYTKISVMKFQNGKIWDVHVFHLSILIVRTYIFFAISNCIWQKNGLENGQFSLFLNFQKSLTMFDKYLCDKFSKFKNLRCTFFSFVHANSQDNFFFCLI